MLEFKIVTNIDTQHATNLNFELPSSSSSSSSVQFEYHPSPVSKYPPPSLPPSYLFNHSCNAQQSKTNRQTALVYPYKTRTVYFPYKQARQWPYAFVPLLWHRPADTKPRDLSHHPHPSVLISETSSSSLHPLEPWNVLVLATIVLDAPSSRDHEWEKLPFRSLLPSPPIHSSFTRVQREDFQSFHSFSFFFYPPSFCGTRINRDS